LDKDFYAYYTKFVCKPKVENGGHASLFVCCMMEHNDNVGMIPERIKKPEFLAVKLAPAPQRPDHTSSIIFVDDRTQRQCKNKRVSLYWK